MVAVRHDSVVIIDWNSRQVAPELDCFAVCSRLYKARLEPDLASLAKLIVTCVSPLAKSWRPSFCHSRKALNVPIHSLDRAPKRGTGVNLSVLLIFLAV